MSFINFNSRSLIAEHEFLEGQEAEIPRITFFVGYEVTYLRRGLEHGSYLELPDAAINITEAVEWAPVLEVLGLIGWHGHLSNVVDHVFIANRVVQELGLIVSVEKVHELRLLPNSVCSQKEVIFIGVPVGISYTEIIILRHLKGSLGFLVLGLSSFNLVFHGDGRLEVVDHIFIGGAHLL